MKQVHDLDALEATLLKGLPFSIQALESVRHQIKYKFQPPKEFFVSDNKKSSFVVIKERTSESVPNFTVYCHESDKDQAEHELKDVIPWDQPWSVGGVPDYLLPILEEQLHKRGLEECLELSDCWVFILENHVELPLIDIPANYKIQQAAPNDVGFIDKLWKFQSDASLQSLRSQAELGLTFGTYVDGEIKSALVVFNFGALGALATAETHRRKGLARMVLNYGVNYLRSQGLTPFAFIEKYNKPSYDLFKKAGFEHTHNAFWLDWKSS